MENYQLPSGYQIAEGEVLRATRLDIDGLTRDIYSKNICKTIQEGIDSIDLLLNKRKVIYGV